MRLFGSFTILYGDMWRDSQPPLSSMCTQLVEHLQVNAEVIGLNPIQTGVLVGEFRKESLRGTKILFCVPRLNLFSCLKGIPIPKHYIISYHIFLAQQPKTLTKRTGK